MNRKIRDLSNLQFGDLVVLDKFIRKHKITFWQVRCKCGTIKYVRQGNLVSGFVTSCGCWKDKFKTDLLGLRIGKYVVIEFSHFKKVDNIYISNYGRGSDKWSIDHIIPVNRFDLSVEEDRYRCYNKFNLQPMWWIDNAKLRTKISKESISA